MILAEPPCLAELERIQVQEAAKKKPGKYASSSVSPSLSLSPPPQQIVKFKECLSDECFLSTSLDQKDLFVLGLRAEALIVLMQHAISNTQNHLIAPSSCHDTELSLGALYGLYG